MAAMKLEHSILLFVFGFQSEYTRAHTIGNEKTHTRLKIKSETQIIGEIKKKRFAM